MPRLARKASQCRLRTDRQRNELTSFELPWYLTTNIFASEEPGFNNMEEASIRRSITLKVIVCTLTLVPVCAESHAQRDAPAKSAYMVEMRDGARLATDVYLPEGADRWPVLLTRLPYDKNNLESAAANFVSLGYAVVAQDVRGTFASEGEFDAFESDGWGKNRDGYDTVVWIASQTWCNGKIGTFGGSALGITQNLMAGARPPNLVCQFVVVACSDFYSQCAFQGGAFREKMAVQWLTDRGAPDIADRWLEHPLKDKWWGLFDCERRHRWINVPAYNVGGWYDIFAFGSVNSFVGLQKHGNTGARGNQKLLMGPWTHGINKREQGELVYPQNANTSKIDRDRIRWFDYWLKGDDNGITREPPMTYYVMGDVDDPGAPGNDWRRAKRWPPRSSQTKLYLQEGGKLARKKQNSSPDTYTFDPDDPVPTCGGQNLVLPAGPMDQRQIGERSDILKYETEPLVEPLEVTGRPSVTFYASSSGPDTDWVVKLVDVYPDGREMLVTDTILRARYRRSFTKPAFMKPGNIYLFDIDFWPTSIVFNRGHRIALHVTSSNYPRFAVNPNTCDGTSKQAAENTIWHDRKHPSALELPVVEAE